MPYGQASVPARPGEKRNAFAPSVANVNGGPLPAQPRPNGSWDAAIALQGIDAHHTFTTEPRMTAPYGPDAATDNQGDIGGYAYEIPVKGPSHELYDGNRRAEKSYWQDRFGGKVDAYGYENFGGKDLRAGIGDITRPRDARNFSIPTDDRQTLHMGPDMGYMTRQGPWLFGQFREARFNGGHSSYAFTPSLRPSPMQYGDGVGAKRFRPTQRQTPDPMQSQYVTQDTQDVPVNIFAYGSMPQYW